MTRSKNNGLCDVRVSLTKKEYDFASTFSVKIHKVFK